MATPKSKGGSCCAVALCKNYSGKAKNTGRTDLSFHRFPKDDLLLKVWSNKCRINDAWNPSPQRQKVRLASQLLSHTTSTALLHCHSILKEDTRLIENVANFIELVNNWFDLVNVSHPNDNRTPYKQPYGNNIEEQNLLLNKMYDTFLKMRCIGKIGLQIFQKAILMHINGTKALLKVLQQNGLKYLLTSKINQDTLENL
ncbi:hypothetical protein ACI65C_006158 [Semiaphis heraclei]